MARRPGRTRRTSIDGQFAARQIALLESPAFRTLSLSARRVLDRIEIEHAHHGGVDNGRLPVTYEDFAAYGMDRHAIPPAIRELEALGIIEVTERGRAGNAEFRTPNRFRLTYQLAKGLDRTHEWKRIQTMEQAQKIARHARAESTSRRTKPGTKKQTAVGNNIRVSGGNAHRGPVGKSPTTTNGKNSTLLSISRGGVRRVGRRKRIRLRLRLDT